MKEFYGALKSVDREIASLRADMKLIHTTLSRNNEQSDKISSLVMGPTNSLLSRINAIEDDLGDLSKELEKASKTLDEISEALKRQALITKIAMASGGVILTLFTSFGPVLWDKFHIHKTEPTKESIKEQPSQKK